MAELSDGKASRLIMLWHDRFLRTYKLDIEYHNLDLLGMLPVSVHVVLRGGNSHDQH